MIEVVQSWVTLYFYATIYLNYFVGSHRIVKVVVNCDEPVFPTVLNSPQWLLGSCHSNDIPLEFPAIVISPQNTDSDMPT